MRKQRKFRSISPPPLRPQGRPPIRTIITAWILFILGTIFLYVGLNKVFKEPISDSSPFMILGALLFIPGVYHVFIIIRIWMGSPGWTYEMLVDLNDN